MTAFSSRQAGPSQQNENPEFLGFLVISADAYFEVAALFEEPGPVDPATFIALLQKHYGVVNVCYLDVYPGRALLHLHRSHHNLPASWTKTYHERSLYSVDAILQEGMRSVRPLDWEELRPRFPRGEIVFELAEAHGIPCRGLTFPQISRGRSAAMLSVNVDVSKREWPTYRGCYLRDIQALASFFHASLQRPRRDGERKPMPELTDREYEVLKWSAAGKSYWEISMILGVSERTVRFFMTNARQKLDVVTNTQAVAQAIWHGLISPA